MFSAVLQVASRPRRLRHSIAEACARPAAKTRLHSTVSEQTIWATHEGSDHPCPNISERLACSWAQAALEALS